MLCDDQDAVDQAAPPKRQRARPRYCRLPPDFPDWTLWRAVARRAKANLGEVLATVLRIECHAARNDGSIGDMRTPIFAAALDIGDDVMGRIKATLEDPEIAWIVGDAVSRFAERNRGDQTAVERKRRQRAKLRELTAGNEPPHRPTGRSRRHPTKKDAASAGEADQSEGPPAPPSADAACGEPVDVIAPKRVSLMDLTPAACRWPFGDPRAPDFGFCGAMTVEGSSYCDKHKAIAHTHDPR
jgi:hypothetical protein